MQLKQVVYVSKVAPSVLAADAEAIAAGASERNADSGLTGFLLYSSRFFLQVLEGLFKVLGTASASSFLDVGSKIGALA